MGALSSWKVRNGGSGSTFPSDSHSCFPGFSHWENRLPVDLSHLQGREDGKLGTGGSQSGRSRSAAAGAAPPVNSRP